MIWRAVVVAAAFMFAGAGVGAFGMALYARAVLEVPVVVAAEPGPDSTDPCSDYWVGHALGRTSHTAMIDAAEAGLPAPTVWETGRVPSPFPGGCRVEAFAGYLYAEEHVGLRVVVCSGDGWAGSEWALDVIAWAALEHRCAAQSGSDIEDMLPDPIPGFMPVGMRNPEAELLDRHAEIGAEIGMLLERVNTDLDRIDDLHAERAEVNYRLRRLRDTGDPMLDLGAGP